MHQIIGIFPVSSPLLLLVFLRFSSLSPVIQFALLLRARAPPPKQWVKMEFSGRRRHIHLFLNFWVVASEEKQSEFEKKLQN